MRARVLGGRVLLGRSVSPSAACYWRRFAGEFGAGRCWAPNCPESRCGAWQRPAKTDSQASRRQESILSLSALRNDRSKEQEVASTTKDAITLDKLNTKAKKYYDQVLHHAPARLRHPL